MISIVESCGCGAKISVVATGDDSAEESLAAFRETHGCGHGSTIQQIQRNLGFAFKKGAEPASGVAAHTLGCAYCGGRHIGNCPKWERDREADSLD